MTDKRYNKHGMERFRASRWEVFKSVVEWYGPEVYDSIMAAFACISLVAVALFGAMLLA